MELRQENNIEKFKPWILLGICLLTFLCYINTLQNQFTNWDDDVYVATNPYIKAFTWENLKVIFTQNVTINYFHPFTLLSIALNYHFAQMSPWSYYFTNILIHIANVILVYFLGNALFSRLKFVGKSGVFFISSLSALWFGIHPMHVESVSWLAERKDVLYTFFYLLGLISYVKYVSGSGSPWKWYAVMLLLFISSCLSKPMAVVFPLSLFCIDFLLQRKWKPSLIIEKIPVLLISLFFGMLAVHFQHEVNSITPFGNIPIIKRLSFASYGFVMYIFKFFLPVNLSTFYPYPCVNMELHVDMPLPLFYYLCVGIAIIMVSLPLYIAYKMNRNYFIVLAFGMGFFIANIVFVLQFISSGMTVMSDRYSYMSYIGLLFIVTFFLQEIIKKFPDIKITVLALTGLASVGLGYRCFERTKVWHNGESLFKDALYQYHDEASLFYKGLGDYYFNNNMKDSALKYYAEWTRLNRDYVVCNDMGNLYKAQKDYPDAIKAYKNSQKSGGNFITTTVEISDIFATIGEIDSAAFYYKIALQINPPVQKLYSDIATALMNSKQYQSCINHYSVLIAVHPSNPYYYFYRGVAKFSDNQIKESLDDFTMPLKLECPKDVMASAAYNLSVSYDKLGDEASAVKYIELAKKDGQVMDTAFYNKLERINKRK